MTVPTKKYNTQSQQLKLQKPTGCEACLEKSTIKTPERRSDVFIVNSKHAASIVNPKQLT